MKASKCILYPLLDGFLLGLVFCLVENLLLTDFFPMKLAPINILLIAGMMLAAAPLWILLPKYEHFRHRVIHFFTALPFFLLTLLLSLVNHLTVNWYLLPIRELSDADGLILLLVLGQFLIGVLTLRAVVLWIRRKTV